MYLIINNVVSVAKIRKKKQYAREKPNFFSKKPCLQTFEAVWGLNVTSSLRLRELFGATSRPVSVFVCATVHSLLLHV